MYLDSRHKLKRPGPKMTMHHKDIGLSFHLQKNWGQLAQKWMSYGHFSAATRIFLKIYLSAIKLFGKKIVSGSQAQFWGDWADSFFIGHIYTQNFGMHHFWGPITQGGGGRIRPLNVIYQAINSFFFRWVIFAFDEIMFSWWF